MNFSLLKIMLIYGANVSREVLISAIKKSDNISFGSNLIRQCDILQSKTSGIILAL